MCPERRRRTVESVRRSLGHGKVSERRVCRVLGQNRGTQRHRPRKVDGDRELLGVMRKIVEAFPRNGCERTHQLLTGREAFGGWKVNVKRVHRIFKEEHMQVPRKQRKRRRLPGARVVLDEWRMDYKRIGRSTALSQASRLSGPAEPLASAPFCGHVAFSPAS
jgi:hypothetical protein